MMKTCAAGLFFVIVLSGVTDNTVSWAESGSNPEKIKEQGHYGLGRPVDPAEIALWDIDVMPDGSGLPPGQGTVSDGAALYQQHCAHCHGVDGVGGSYGSLVGRLEDDAFPFANDRSIKKTIGNYWPYATTVFDYIRRAMPLEAPGSLADGEVYSLVAWLLYRNEIIAEETMLSAENLATIKMPSRNRFVPDNRRGGAEVR